MKYFYVEKHLLGTAITVAVLYIGTCWLAMRVFKRISVEVNEEYDLEKIKHSKEENK